MTQEIFAWVNYGNINLYAVDSIDQIKLVYELVVATLEMWDDEETQEAIEKAQKFIANRTDVTPEVYKKAILWLVDHVNVGSHESFEYGTGFHKVKNAQENT